MNILKLLSMVSVITIAAGFSIASAENKIKSAADQSTEAKQLTQSQTKVVSVAEAMQYTPAQKAGVQPIQKQQAEHTQQMQIKYRELIVLSKTEKLDKGKISEVTDEMVSMIRKFAAESTAANHDFYSSLTPDQIKRAEAINKQLQQRQQQQQQQQPAPKK